MKDLAFNAMNFARAVHRSQVRKYTGNPYSDHLAEVAGIAMTVCWEWNNPDEIMAVAWLHDCMEDQHVDYATLSGHFGAQVASGVQWLSDMETGSRAERKAASRRRLAQAPGWIQTIKCADLISNTSSIVKHDPKFAETYLEEKRELLKVLTSADRRLHSLASMMACQV